MNALERLLRAPANRALVLLGGFTAFSVFGYWNFALHPERLPGAGWALDLFTVSFQFFAQLHIVLAALVLGVVLVRQLGWRWWPALVAVYCISLFSELIGTRYGVPFGEYQYTGLLGFKWAGRVPFLIPLSWFLMALPSWVMARAAAGKGASRLARLALGASWLLVWDLALDPAMSYLTPYWRWEDSGPYYGMPWVNLGGWFVTGLALMATLDLLSERGDWASVPVRWMASYYAVVLALPLGMVVAGGLWIAALATVSSLGLVAALSIAVRRRPAVQELTVRAVEPNPVGVR